MPRKASSKRLATPSRDSILRGPSSSARLDRPASPAQFFSATKHAKTAAASPSKRELQGTRIEIGALGNVAPAHGRRSELHEAVVDPTC